MGIITLKNYPNETLSFELPEVESDPIEINIHMVRVYNDGETAISILNLKTETGSYYYATVSDPRTSPAKVGQYFGYLIRRHDNKDEIDKSNPDGQKTKKRIENIFNKLKKFDERLPEEFQSGKQNYNYGGHNGLRIFQQNLPYKEFEHWTRLDGGNRFFHVANLSSEVIGCEGLGLYADIYIEEEESSENFEYAVWKSKEATADFLNNIIAVYEKNVDRTEQSAVHINIEIEDNIQSTIKKGDKLDPRDLYNKLYPPREKAKRIETPKPKGLKHAEIETENIDFNKE